MTGATHSAARPRRRLLIAGGILGVVIIVAAANAVITGSVMGLAAPVVWPFQGLAWLYQTAPVVLFVLLFALAFALFFLWFRRLSRTLPPDRQFEILHEHWLFEGGDPEQPFKMIGSLWWGPFLRFFVRPDGGGGEGALILPAIGQWNADKGVFEEYLLDRHWERLALVPVELRGPWSPQEFRRGALEQIFEPFATIHPADEGSFETALNDEWAKIAPHQAGIRQDEVRDLYVAVVFDRTWHIRIHNHVALNPTLDAGSDAHRALVKETVDFSNGFYFGSILSRPEGAPENAPDWPTYIAGTRPLTFPQLAALEFPHRTYRAGADGRVRYGKGTAQSFVPENARRIGVSAAAAFVFAAVTFGSASLSGTLPGMLGATDRLAATGEVSDDTSNTAGDTQRTTDTDDTSEQASIDALQDDTAPRVRVIETTPELPPVSEEPDLALTPEPEPAEVLDLDPNARWTYGTHPVLGETAHVVLGDEVIGIACGAPGATVGGATTEIRFTPGLAQISSGVAAGNAAIDYAFDGLDDVGGALPDTSSGAYLAILGDACTLNVEAFMRGRALILLDRNADPAGSVRTWPSRGRVSLGGSSAAIQALIDACPSMATDLAQNCGR
ncbi:MAG: hypothetical protein AAFX39_00765 [Pseudomonadota bacterium]